MPSQTFLNLKPEKQARIYAALLTEFSTYPLANAQVARIVKDAQIARGAFYKYFMDLADAYQTLWQRALHQLHSQDELAGHLVQTPATYTQQVRQLLTAGAQQGLRDLLRLHYSTNEAYLGATVHPTTGPHFDAQTWAVMTLTHQAIKECLVAPDQEEQILARLERALTDLMEEKTDVSGD